MPPLHAADESLTRSESTHTPQPLLPEVLRFARQVELSSLVALGEKAQTKKRLMGRPLS